MFRHETIENYLGPSWCRLCAEDSWRQLPVEKLFAFATRCGATSSLWGQPSLRSVLTGLGPKYVNFSNIGVTMQVRRVLNIYYDRAFAEVLYREIVLHHSNASWPIVKYGVELLVVYMRTCAVWRFARCGRTWFEQHGLNQMVTVAMLFRLCLA